ncbi:sugar kinase [Kineococcus sp. SYSU DK004]|uniref:sugar kinase n=1 Tax=Kineococcus sp. SYSU DK004 TaxID=3383125 RepID=UPI003D7E779B
MSAGGLALRPATECAFDVVALGEVMLRFDPGEGRVRTARRFDVHEGGGEYNVARGLRRCFGRRTAVVTALVDDEVGRLVEDLVLTGGVDTSLLRWVPGDGAGRTVRNGLNFVERGFGVRRSVGVSDRGSTAVSRLRPGDVDWDDLFGRRGVRWFHTGGIFAALSGTTSEVAAEALAAARRHGTVTSYDLNYRPSLWAGRGGAAAAQELNRRLVADVDVLLGAGLAGLPGEGGRDVAAARERVLRDAEQNPGLRVVATTVRGVVSASRNDLTAVAHSRGTGLVQGPDWRGLDVLDRIGSGDAFTAGLVHGLLDGGGLQRAVDLGVAHGALVATTPGDSSAASLGDVEQLLASGDASVSR